MGSLLYYFYLQMREVSLEVSLAQDHLANPHNFQNEDQSL